MTKARKEAESLSEIKKFLQIQGIPFIRMQPISPCGQGKWRPVEKSQHGAPDLVLVLKGGKTLWVEVKGDKGKQTKAQEEWQRTLEEYGHRYIVVRSVSEVAFAIAFAGYSGTKM